MDLNPFHLIHHGEAPSMPPGMPLPDQLSAHAAAIDAREATTTTGAVAALPAAQEAHMNVFQHIGKDIKGVFAWLSSDKGQRTVQTVETAATITAAAIGGTGAQAVLTKAFALVNTWGTEIVKSEAIAAAAGEQNGTGVQKAAAVINTMEPQIMEFLQGQGLTSDQVTAKAKTVNDALVLVFKTLGGDEVAQAGNGALAGATGQ